MDRLQFYLTLESPCSYLPDRESANIVPDPAVPLDARLYDRLVEHGFRRSGNHVYRPHCPKCSACVPLRIRVNDFNPRRTDRRLLKNNRDIVTRVLPAEFQDEHFALYRHYLAQRHPGGGMENPEPDDYLGFLTAHWSRTRFAEFRRDGELLAIAVFDIVRNGLSAVYTFFDPDQERHALGRYAVLWEIEEARRMGLEYLYLGYWIAESPKMAYKIDYQPAEGLINEHWVAVARPEKD